MMWRWATKLTSRIPSVPSATPAHENSASTGSVRVSRAASTLSMLLRSTRTEWSTSTLASAMSKTVTRAPSVRTSDAVAAPMPVAPPTTSARLPL